MLEIICINKILKYENQEILELKNPVVFKIGFIDMIQIFSEQFVAGRELLLEV